MADRGTFPVTHDMHSCQLTRAVSMLSALRAPFLCPQKHEVAAGLSVAAVRCCTNLRTSRWYSLRRVSTVSETVLTVCRNDISSCVVEAQEKSPVEFLYIGAQFPEEVAILALI